MGGCKVAGSYKLVGGGYIRIKLVGGGYTRIKLVGGGYTRINWSGGGYTRMKMAGSWINIKTGRHGAGHALKWPGAGNTTKLALCPLFPLVCRFTRLSLLACFECRLKKKKKLMQLQ